MFIYGSCNVKKCLPSSGRVARSLASALEGRARSLRRGALDALPKVD